MKEIQKLLNIYKTKHLARMLCISEHSLRSKINGRRKFTKEEWEILRFNYKRVIEAEEDIKRIRAELYRRR